MIATAFLFAFCALAAHGQYLGYPQYPLFDQSYFNAYNADGSSGEINPNSRFFFNGALLNALRPTVTLITTTSTSTVFSTLTCTTSTAALTTCSPAGRRRRGLLLNSKKGRSLFYADDEETNDDSIFLPSKPEEIAAVEEPTRESRSADSKNQAPFVVQSGINAPQQLRNARQLLSFGTRTITTTTTATNTLKLTAVCASTTGFPTC